MHFAFQNILNPIQMVYCQCGEAMEEMVKVQQ